jgi:hypothetical protein
LSSLSLPPNPSRTRRSKHLAESDERRRQRALEDPEMPMIVSQASVSKSQNSPPDNMNMIMFNMLQKMQENQEASNKRNIDMLEHHRLDMEM